MKVVSVINYKLRNVHVSKADDLARIKEKLVEVIIGARLSSRAIRGDEI